jgi:Zn-dependent protease with chaperone function
MADSQNKPAPHSPAKALQAPSAKLAEGADGEPSSREPSSRELLAAIPERLEVPSANSAYSFELLAVACLMVLLPVLYVAIIVAVGWGVVWHFQHNTWLLNGDGSNRARGRGGFFLVLAYLAPGVVGVGLFITLLKPLFAGWWGGDDPRVPLERRDQPLLFAFVDRLCDALGSPRPHAIYVDEQANASAGLVGVSGLLTNRLQLTVGLPLVAGMPLRNLSGILAHEFGHFSQFWGMRLSGAINLVNAWLSHVVEHRDSVDEWVAAAASSLDLRIGWTLYLVQFANWLVRKLLRGLQLLGVLFSRRLMWQMEFHADAYEAELAGSETFRGTFTRLGLIMAANAMAREEFGHFASRKQLVDNFTLFTTGQVKLLKPEVRKAVRAHLSEDKSEWYETHPAPKDRIRVVEEAARPGVFTLDAPATALFRDFDGLCRTTTRKHYRQVLGRPVKETELCRDAGG